MVARIGSGSDLSHLRYLEKANKEKEKSLAKLSSGKINPLENPAAAAIVAELEAQVATTHQAVRNIGDAASLVAVAEGALSNINDSITRIKELTIQANNGTYSQEQRQAMQAEAQQLSQEINRTLQATEFNGRKIFADSANPELDVQVGNGSDENTKVSFSFGELAQNASALLSIDLMSPEGRTAALSTLDSFQNQVISKRGQMGAFESRLNTADETARKSAEADEAAASRIRDIDYAEETAKLTRNNILTQTSAAMAAHSSLQQQIVLQLLR